MKLDNWESQIKKGTLEFIILLVLEKDEYYGYELIKKIKKTVDIDTSEGTIYPILNRLKKSGYVSSRWEHPDTGIPRKYYSITKAGRSALEEMKQSWITFSESIKNMIGKK